MSRKQSTGPRLRRTGPRTAKTFRLSLGPVAGGTIKLDRDEDVSLGLCVGEGVATCLSGRQMGLSPVWALISTAGIAAFPVLPGIEGLHILGENDGASAKAVKECEQRWLKAGAPRLSPRQTPVATTSTMKFEDLPDENRAITS
jgi:hypothetical protein